MHHLHRMIYFVLGSIALFSCSSEPENEIKANTSSSVLTVDYVVVRPEALVNNIQVTGSLMPKESAQLTTQTAGKVQQILFSEGESVSKGQVLLTLDDREWKAQLKRMQAELEMAEKDLTRKAALEEMKGISEADLDAAQLRVKSLEATIEETQVRLSYSTIKAPFSGRIGLRNVSPGAYISAGTSVAMLIQDNPIKMQFDVPERYAAMVRPGQRLTFFTNDRPEAYEARVYAAEPMINARSRSMSVRAEADNTSQELISGSYADITFTLDSVSDALMVPTDAIIPKLNNQLVFRITNGKAEEVNVRTGIRHPKEIQVTSGLQEGDTVIVTGLLQIKPGMAVAAAKEVEVESFEKGQ